MAELTKVVRQKWDEIFVNILNNVRIGNPANIRLDEDVLKTSFVFVFRRRLQDVLIKTNMFTLPLRLQKTSSRRLYGFSFYHNSMVLVFHFTGT